MIRQVLENIRNDTICKCIEKKKKDKGSTETAERMRSVGHFNRTRNN